VEELGVFPVEVRPKDTPFGNNMTKHSNPTPSNPPA